MAAKPFKYKIEIVQGATLRDTVTWKVGEPSAPVDLTGATARMQVRDKLSSPAVLLELTSDNGGIVLGGAAGTVTLYMDDAATAAITWSAGVYDLEVVLAGGDVRRLLAGAAVVLPEVTRIAP